MPRDHAALRRRQKPELLARIAAGRTIKSVCRDPDMPCETSIAKWARADALFSADLAQARRAGEHRRRAIADPVKGAAFLEGLRQGQSVTALLSRPGMPSRDQLRGWLNADQVFGPEVRRVMEINAGERRNLRWTAHRAVWERPIDEALADQILLRVLRGEPIGRVCSALKLSRPRALDPWRRANPDWERAFKIAIKIGHKRRGGERSRCTPDLIRTIETRILHGETLQGLAKQPDMPSANSLYTWIRDHPHFAEAVARAAAFRNELLMERVADLAEQATSHTLASAKSAMAKLSRRARARLPGQQRRSSET